MGFYTNNGSVPNTILISVIVFVFTELILAVPVSIEPNSRAFHNVDSHRRNSWNENNPVNNLLLSQQQKQNETSDSNSNRREIQTGDGTSSTEDIGDGSDEVELDDGDGTFSNDTQAGSRLRKNETEPCSLEPAVLCPSVAPHSNRDKQRRIAHIVNYLWTNLFENRTRSVKPTPERFNPVNPSSSSFSGGLESISATCDLPPEVESEAWSSERYLSLYFNLSSKYSDILGSIQTTSENSSSEPQQQQGEGESHESGHSQEYLPAIGSRPFLTTFTITPTKTVNIISAKLRLYKIGTSDNANNVPSIADIERTSEPCNDTDANASDSVEDVVPSVFPTRMTFPSVDEKIRVSVFWYTQPATKNHYKKKLVDAKMLSLRESSWVEFDIKNAVTAWLNERKPNYGLVIEVENENQDALDPRQYFRGAPCFKSPTSEGNEGEGTVKDINSAMSPIIEICTLNVPQTTSNYEHTKFFPFSMNMNSINHLQRVAESHAKSTNSNGSSARPRFPSSHNINLNMLSPEDFGLPNPSSNSRNDDDQSGRPRKTIIVPSHRHRHHHDLSSQAGSNNEKSETTGENRRHQRGKARPSNTQQFTLDEDHPLRQILASVNGNSKESNRRGSGSQQFPKGFPSHLMPDMPADEGKSEVEYFDSTEHDKDVFITKIVISPAQLKNGFGNRRVFLPFATSMATSASSASVVPPTASTNVESSER